MLHSFIGWIWLLWHVGDCGMCVVGKMAKDVATAIRLITFLRFHPYMVLHFIKCFFFNLFKVNCSAK